MREIQPKPQKKPFPLARLRSLFVILVLFVAAVILIRGTWGVFQKERESRQNAAEVKTELQALLERKHVLEEETRKLNTQEGIEEAIREKFQVSKDGESVIVVVDKQEMQEAVVEEKGVFSKIWEGFAGVFKKD